MKLNKREKLFREKVAELYDRGMSVSEITNEVESMYPHSNRKQVYTKVRDYIRRNLATDVAPKTTSGSVKTASDDIPTNKSIFYNANGERNIVALLPFGEKEEVTPEAVLRNFNMDPKDWIVSGFRMTARETIRRTEGMITLWNCSLNVKPTNLVRLQDVEDNAIKLIDYNKIPIFKPSPVKVAPKKQGANVLEIDIADLHYGLYATKTSSGEDYNRDIARKKLISALNAVFDEIDGISINSVKLITLGDFVHVDNGKQTTTAGTFQQIDGNIYQVLAGASQLLIEAIDVVRKRSGVPVEYVYVPGNHDREMGFMVAQNAQSAYRNVKDVKFNVSECANKCIRYGKDTIVGFCHGDMNSKNLADLLPTQFPDDFALSTRKNVRVHCGHLHTYATKADIDRNVLVKHFPTLCASSLWEHRQGYHSPEGLAYEIYNTKTGNIIEGVVTSKI